MKLKIIDFGYWNNSIYMMSHLGLNGLQYELEGDDIVIINNEEIAIYVRDWLKITHHGYEIK